jgi:hypothetical protein
MTEGPLLKSLLHHISVKTKLFSMNFDKMKELCQSSKSTIYIRFNLVFDFDKVPSLCQSSKSTIYIRFNLVFDFDKVPSLCQSSY